MVCVNHLYLYFGCKCMKYFDLAMGFGDFFVRAAFCLSPNILQIQNNFPTFAQNKKQIKK